MEQQQQRQESLERRTSTTGMYKIHAKKQIWSPCFCPLVVVGFCMVSYIWLKIIKSQNGRSRKARLGPSAPTPAPAVTPEQSVQDHVQVALEERETQQSLCATCAHAGMRVMAII